MVYSTYDIVANFSVETGNNLTNPSSIVYKVSLPSPQKGKILLGSVDINVKSNAVDTSGVVTLSNVTALTSDNQTINLDMQTINVTVGTPSETEDKDNEEEEIVDKNLLDKIDSKIIKIDLKKDVFEYKVTINDNVTELDLDPVAKDSTSKIEVSSQKISELKDNTIFITVSNDDIVQEYKIIVNIKENKSNSDLIDNEVFVPDDNYKKKWMIVIIALLIGLPIGMILNRHK